MKSTSIPGRIAFKSSESRTSKGITIASMKPGISLHDAVKRCGPLISSTSPNTGYRCSALTQGALNNKNANTIRHRYEAVVLVMVYRPFQARDHWLSPPTQLRPERGRCDTSAD